MSETLGQERTCPLCGGAAAKPLPRYSTAEWHVVSCKDCGFVYLRNPPEYQELVSDFAWERTFSAETSRRKKRSPFLTWLDWKTRWRLHAFARSKGSFYLELFRQGPVLDIGCGGGCIAPEPLIPYGIEISRVLYEKAKVMMAARGGEAVHGAAADAIAKFPDRFFTGVIMASIVEHESQPKKLLADVARVLADGGKAYIRVPNFGGLNRMARGANWCGFRYPDHVNYFTVASLRRMAAECGMKLRLLNPIRLPFDDNINAVLSKA